MFRNVIEGNDNHFYEYYNPYINKDWKQEYFPYDHFKTICKTLKEKAQPSQPPGSLFPIKNLEELLIDLRQQCHIEIKKVHRFIVNMILTIDLDLQTINEMLEAEGITVKKPSEMRTVMTRRASDADMIYSDQRHIARQSSIVVSESKSDLAGYSDSTRGRLSRLCRKVKRSCRQCFKACSHQNTDQQIQRPRKVSFGGPSKHPSRQNSKRSNSRQNSKSDRRTDGSNYSLVPEDVALDGNHDGNNNEDSNVNNLSNIEEEVIEEEEGNNEIEVDPSSRKRALTTDHSVRDHSMELSLRNVYLRIKLLEQFYHLNFYIISKVSKKIDKLMKLVAIQAQVQQQQHVNGKKSSHPIGHYNSDGKDNQIPGGLKSSKKLPLVTRTWKDTRSGRFFFKEFVASKNVIEELKDECVSSYAKKFRKTYTHLATYELEYVKEKARTNSSTKLYVGIKFGLIACMVAWILVDSYSMESQTTFDFWAQPGLYVYTTIGNLLLYRLCWAFNVLIWSKYDINYISILHLKNIKPNLLRIMDETGTLLVWYFINLLVFFRINAYEDDNIEVSRYPYLSYGCPLLLIVVSICYVFYEYLYLFGGESISIGVFNFHVLRRCLQAPFVPVTFRDSFAANVLTSFTRIIADSLYASCWIVSGAFLDPYGQTQSDFGSNRMQCTGTTMIQVVSIVQMLPIFVRLLQCLRNWKERHFLWFPPGLSVIKYIVSIIVVVLALLYRDGSGVGTDVYYFFIAFSTVFKWWWDVVMDWGLFDDVPKLSWSNLMTKFQNKHIIGTSSHNNANVNHNQKYQNGFTGIMLYWKDSIMRGIYVLTNSTVFLRTNLMYPNSLFYYVSIVLDLVLRFLWVLSLLPPDSLPKQLAGYQLSFFRGSMEILRRCMWAMFRVEHEHLKMMDKKTPGFLSNQVMRKREDWLFTTGDDYENEVDDTNVDDENDAAEKKSDADGYDSDTASVVTLQSMRVRRSIKSRGRMKDNTKSCERAKMMLSQDSQSVVDADDKSTKVRLVNHHVEMTSLFRSDATSKTTIDSKDDGKSSSEPHLDEDEVKVTVEEPIQVAPAPISTTEPIAEDKELAKEQETDEECISQLVHLHRRNSIFDLPEDVLLEPSDAEVEEAIVEKSTVEHPYVDLQVEGISARALSKIEPVNAEDATMIREKELNTSDNEFGLSTNDKYTMK